MSRREAEFDQLFGPAVEAEVAYKNSLTVWGMDSPHTANLHARRDAARTALLDLLVPEPQPDPGFDRMVPTGTRAERLGTK